MVGQSPANSKVNYLESAQLNGFALTFMDRFTYLGQVLHRDITDGDDIGKQTTKVVTGNTRLTKFSH